MPDRRLRERDVQALPAPAPGGPDAAPSREALSPDALREFTAALEACWRMGAWPGDLPGATARMREAVLACQARLGGAMDGRIVDLVVDWLRTWLASEQPPTTPHPWFAGAVTRARPRHFSQALAAALGAGRMPVACLDAFFASLARAPIETWPTVAFTRVLMGGFADGLVERQPRHADVPARPPVPACTDALARWALGLPDVALAAVDLVDGLPSTIAPVLGPRLTRHAASAQPRQLRQLARLAIAQMHWQGPFQAGWVPPLTAFFEGAARSVNPHALAAAVAGVFDAQSDHAPTAGRNDETAYGLYEQLAKQWLPLAPALAPAGQLALGAVLARGLVGARQAVWGLVMAWPPAYGSQLAQALHGTLDRVQALVHRQARSAPQLGAGFAAVSPVDGSFSLARGLEDAGDPAGLAVAALSLEGRYDAVAALRALAPREDMAAAADWLVPWLAAELEPGDVPALCEALLRLPGAAGDVETDPKRDPPAPPSSLFAAVTNVLIWIDTYGRYLGLDPGGAHAPEAMPQARWERHAAILQQAIDLGTCIAAGAGPKDGRATAIARFASDSEEPGDPKPGLVVVRLWQLRFALEARHPDAVSHRQRLALKRRREPSPSPPAPRSTGGPAGAPGACAAQ